MGFHICKALPARTAFITGVIIAAVNAAVISGPLASANAQTIDFAVPALEPYGFFLESDRRNFGSGALPDIIARIGQSSGLDIEVTVLPIKRVNKQLFLGGSHCAILLQTAHLKQKLDQIAEVQPRFPSVIVSRLGFEVKRVGDLRGHILSIPRGSYAGYPIADDPLIRRELSNCYAQSVRLLKAGRVDAIAGTALSIFFNLSRHGMTRQSHGAVLIFDNTPLWLQCRHEALSADILERLRKATKAVRDTGIVKEILQRYAGGYISKNGS